MNDSFVFYRSFYEAIKNIPIENRLETYEAIFEYSLNDNIPENLGGISKAMFILVKPCIDSAIKKYSASVANGKKGGRPKENKPSNNLNLTKQEPKPNLNVDVDVDVYLDLDDNVDLDVNKNVDIIKPINLKTNKFIKPTIEEIKEYCLERKNNIDGEQFYYFYESKGWVIGKDKMKDWKSCIITWEKKEKQQGKIFSNIDNDPKNWTTDRKDYSIGDD